MVFIGWFNGTGIWLLEPEKLYGDTSDKIKGLQKTMDDLMVDDSLRINSE